MLTALSIQFVALMRFYRPAFCSFAPRLEPVAPELGRNVFDVPQWCAPGRTPTPSAGLKIGLDFTVEGLDLGSGFFHAMLQGRAAPKGDRVGTGSHPDPNALQLHQVLLHQ